MSSRVRASSSPCSSGVSLNWLARWRWLSVHRKADEGGIPGRMSTEENAARCVLRRRQVVSELGDTPLGPTVDSSSAVRSAAPGTSSLCAHGCATRPGGAHRPPTTGGGTRRFRCGPSEPHPQVAAFRSRRCLHAGSDVSQGQLRRCSAGSEQASGVVMLLVHCEVRRAKNAEYPPRKLG